MRKLSVTVVGAGNIGQTEHMPAYQKLKDLVEVVAIVDINLQRARESATKYGVPKAYDSIDALLADGVTDIVDVCTWNVAHEDVAVKAMRAGAAVICEKPLAHTLESATRIQQVVQETGRPFMMAMVSRFRAEIQMLHEMIKAGELGEIYYAKTGYIRRRGTPIGWFTDRAKSGGGALIDIGVHNIDSAWYLMGCPKPVRVSGKTANLIGNFKTRGVSRWEALDRGDGTFDTEDSAVGIIYFENGATLFVEASWAINGLASNYTHIYGSKGGASLNPIVIYSENQQGYLVDLAPQLERESRFESELRHFAQCVLSGESPMITIDQGITVQKMIDGIYRSALEDREIEL